MYNNQILDQSVENITPQDKGKYHSPRQRKISLPRQRKISLPQTKENITPPDKGKYYSPRQRKISLPQTQKNITPSEKGKFHSPRQRKITLPQTKENNTPPDKEHGTVPNVAAPGRELPPGSHRNQVCCLQLKSAESRVGRISSLRRIF